jgi:hypothetical protein
VGVGILSKAKCEFGFDSYNDFKKYLLGNTGNHQFIWYNTRNSATTINSWYQIIKCLEVIPGNSQHQLQVHGRLKLKHNSNYHLFNEKREVVEKILSKKGALQC